MKLSFLVNPFFMSQKILNAVFFLRLKFLFLEDLFFANSEWTLTGVGIFSAIFLGLHKNGWIIFFQ